MTTTSMAVAADHADTLMTLRRAKWVAVSVVLFVLLTQLTVFFGIRYGHWLPTPADGKPLTAAQERGREGMQYLVGLLDFAGLIVPGILSIVLFVALMVQVVGRLAGTGRAAAAVVWAGTLAVLMFPWQSVLNNPGINRNAADNAIGLKVPGVVYTWAEVSHPTLGAQFVVVHDKDGLADSVLHWARYVGFPVVALALLGAVIGTSERGTRRALGGGGTTADGVSTVPVGTTPQL